MPTSCAVPLETLTDFVEGRLPAPEEACLLEHLGAACPLCAERLRWLRQMLPSLPKALPDAAPVPTTDSLDFVRSLGHLLSPGRPRVRHIAHRHTSPGASGAVRGAASAAESAVYETERHLLMLWTEPEKENRYYLIGQLYERGGSPLSLRNAELVGRNGLVQTANQEETEFSLRAVPAGVYLLCCALESEEVIVPKIEVGGVGGG